MIAPADLASSFQPLRAKTDDPGRAAASRQEALHDAGLVRRFNAGDEAAFVEIVGRHRGKIYSAALWHLHNHADAEEVTQDTFIRAHRGLARFRGDASLATWLRHIALNLARNHYWYFFRRGRQTTLSLDCPVSADDPAPLSNLVAADAANPARAAMVREFSELVAVCMARLGAQHREVLTLRNSLNRSYDEIAQELGISVGTVKSRIARARESLRLLLAEAYPEFNQGASPGTWFDPIRFDGGVEIIYA